MPHPDSPLYLPAEWESQCAVMLIWPHANSDWQALLGEIEPVYTSLCKTISETETCLVICHDEAHKKHVEQILGAHAVTLARCWFFVCETNDTWCRDYGLITTRADGRLLLNNFVFNGWGGKYDATLDNAASRQLQRQGLFHDQLFIDRDFELEGGSIESDGRGTILTTSQCLLKRHPDKTREQIEQAFKDMLGSQRVLWLDHGGLGGDDTDSHIDNLARFVDANTIAYTACHDESHPDYPSLYSMQMQLREFSREDGTPYRLIPVYLPSPIYDGDQLLPASYVNFLVLNDRVLVPVFGQDTDKAALTTFEQCFPGRRIIATDSNALIKQYGGIHCATMQFPEGVI